MGIMQAWEKWSQKQYDSWGSKLQSKYDKYRALKTPDWYLKLTEGIWDSLDGDIKQWLNTLVTDLCKTFDEEFAHTLLKKIIAEIKKLFPTG